MALKKKSYRSIKSRFISYMIQILVISAVISIVGINSILQIAMRTVILPADYYEEQMPKIREVVSKYGGNLTELNSALAKIMPSEGIEYKILDKTGIELFQYGKNQELSKKQAGIKRWRQEPEIDKEQKLVEGWIKPYVIEYLPITEERSYKGTVIVGYWLYNTSRVPIIKEIVPYLNLIIVGIPFLILVITILIYTRKFVNAIEKPLNTLREGIDKIQNDDLDFKLESDSQDEIGQLCLSFEKMRLALQQSLEANWEKEEERKHLISGLAHDLRTPITVIKGHTELMLEDEESSNKLQQESILAIQKNTERLEKLVQALNQINKWQQIDLLGDKQKINIEDLLCERLKDYQVLALKNQITIVYKEGMIKKNTFLSVSAWSQILDNLISNSLRFTPKGGKILIRTELNENQLILNVEDSGCGFQEEDLKQITNLFYQEDKSRNSGQHHGIGLYIVDYLVKKMNGDMRFYKSELGGAGVQIVVNVQS